MIFDIETDGLEATKVHCIGVIHDDGVSELFGPDRIEEGLDALGKADKLIGHNIINYDLPVLKNLFNFKKRRVIDTLVLSRVIETNLYDRDALDQKIPKNMFGSQSLAAWGHRLGNHKQEIETDWSEYTEEMGKYCLQDVAVTKELFNYLMSKEFPKSCLLLEHQFAHIMQSQMERGFSFDSDKANELVAKLQSERIRVTKKLQELFPPEIEKTNTVKGWKIEVNGEEVVKKTKGAIKEWLKENKLKQNLANDAVKIVGGVKETPFNPSSRVQIEKRFVEKYNWKPKVLTPNGRAKIDEAVLRGLSFEEAPVLMEYLLIQKRLSQIAEGNEAWTKLEKEGRIYGRINSNGALSGRCTHSKPNIAQVPANNSAFGGECRELFKASKGYVLVGCDASGLELRCLAHYLYRFDGGLYAKEVVSGDIHTLNQKAAGLPNRDEAKRFIYAYLYGAGDELIGKIVGGGIKEGKKIKKEFLAKTPALKKLKTQIDLAVDAGRPLIGLDGRKLNIRSKHSALNLLLQSAGAVIMKKATVNLNELLHQQKVQAYNVAHIHDEIQLETLPEEGERVGTLAVQAIQNVTRDYNLKCPLDGEYKIGNNWKETH